jgi:hypothetical protein
MRKIEIPALFKAVNSKFSPNFPKVIKEDNNTDNFLLHLQQELMDAFMAGIPFPKPIENDELNSELPHRFGLAFQL